ncbi:hypothetical protein ACLX1H_004504 [Fusarium chlamydosporum]
MTRLPLEIIQLIFKHFCRHCCGEYEQPFRVKPPTQNATTLHNLCLVSRHFRDVAQVILHHSFDFDFEPPKCLPYTDSWKRRLEPFLRTIASRPDLARSVNAVFLPWELIVSLDFDQSKKSFDTCARSMGISALEIYQLPQRHGAPSSDAIEEAFFQGHPIPDDAGKQDHISLVASELVTIAMAMLPNLAHLVIVAKDLLYEKWDIDISTSTLDALNVDYLPLKTLESDEAMPKLLSRTVDLQMLVTGGRGLFPRMANLKRLHIRSINGVRLSGRDASPVEACIGCLTSFSFTAAYRRIANLIEALDQPRFHTTLESIRLDLRCRPTEHEIDPILTFRSFTKLNTLFIPACPIYGSNYTHIDPQSLVTILPPNIQSLTLVEHETPTPPGLLHKDLLRLVEKKSTLFPHLIEIISDSVQVCDGSLKTMMENVGIALIHREIPWSRWDFTRQYRYDDYTLWDPQPVYYPLPSELSDDDL